MDVTNCNNQSEVSGDTELRPDCIFDLCPQTSSDVDWDTFKPVVHVYCDGTTVSLHGLGFASDDPVQNLPWVALTIRPTSLSRLIMKKVLPLMVIQPVLQLPSSPLCLTSRI